MKKKNKELKVHTKEILRHGIFGLVCCIGSVVSVLDVNQTFVQLVSIIIILGLISSFFVKQEQSDERADKNLNSAGENSFLLLSLLLLLYAGAEMWLPKSITLFAAIYFLLGISQMFHTVNFLILEKRGN